MSEHQPGDVFLDRYMPTASLDEREEARKRLYEFVETLMAMGERLLASGDKEIRQNDVSELDSPSGNMPSP
jgi:hypothetical protein